MDNKSSFEDQKKQSFRVLGLDVGIASVGAAVVDLGTETIEGLYVRTFDKAEVAKTGESLNAVRRESRGVRRRLRRRRLRLREVLSGLIKHSQEALVDSISPTVFSNDPWGLRVRGLTEALSPVEFAGCIYHLQKYRGFQSNRRNESASDDVGKMKSGISQTKERMQASGTNTVAELAQIHDAYKTQKRNRRGDYSRAVDRALVDDEFTLLFSKQRRMQPSIELFSEDSEALQRELLYRRKPVGSAEDILKMVGDCTLEPKELRAPKSTFSFERFVWLQKLNSIQVNRRGEKRPLTAPQRDLIREFPYQKSKLTFAQVRKVLGLEESELINLCRYRDEPSIAEKATLFEAKFYHSMRKVLVGHEDVFELLRADPEQMDALGSALTICMTPDELNARLEQEGFDSKLIAAVAEESFSGFGNLSLKAIRQLLPFLEQGQRYDEAVASAGYRAVSSQQNQTPRVPMVDREEIRNPVVARGMRQAIRVINAILAKHGPMHSIHVELARDVGKPASERRKIELDQGKYQKARADARDMFLKEFGAEPRRDELQKFLLYKEQDGKCAYSGEPLDINRLFEVGYSQVDHIQPFSRTFDDSQVNKALVRGVENQKKGNMTPFEYFGRNQQKWQEFDARVRSNPKIRFSKKNRLLAESLPDKKDFIDRNLNDTRYFSRLLKTHLERHLFLEKSLNSEVRGGIVCVTGRATGFLRHRWGLAKDRAAGDRHHAMDAAVVAGASRSMIQRITRYNQRHELKDFQGGAIDYDTGEIIDLDAVRRMESQFPVPYNTFRDELLARLSDDPKTALKKIPQLPLDQTALDSVRPMLVSRALKARGTGAAHEATIRRQINHPDPWVDAGWTSKKVPLTQIDEKQLKKVVGRDDPREAGLHRLIEERLKQYGGDPKKAFEEPLYRRKKDGSRGPVVWGLRVMERHPTGVQLQKKGGMADNGSMVRLDVYRIDNKFVADPIYVVDLVDKLRSARYCKIGVGQSNWPLTPAGLPKLFSLYRNSYVRIQKKDGQLIEGYYVGFDIASSRIKIRTHDGDQRKGEEGFFRIGIASLKQFEVMHVDILGNRYPSR